MRVTAEKIHVFGKNEFGSQVEHAIYNLSCKAYSISGAAKLFAYAISNLKLKEGGIESISLHDIASALELLEVESYELGGKIGNIGEALGDNGVLKELNKFDSSRVLPATRNKTHREDLEDEDVL